MPEPPVPGATPLSPPRTPYWRDSTSTLYVGDARDVLAEMTTGSADCIVTSPPYWGKRDYRVAGQYGHEPDPDAYVETLRATFAEAWRVLADDGTCWLNLGDSYSAGGGAATGKHAYLGRHLTGHRAAWHASPRTFSACPGASRSHCRRTAGSCGTRSSGTSRTPCPNRSAIGSTAATNCSSCSSSSPPTGSTSIRSVSRT